MQEEPVLAEARKFGVVQGRLISLVGITISVAGFMFSAIYRPSVGIMDWRERLAIVLGMALVAAFRYGTSWSLGAQKILRTDYGEETSMPTGWHAVVLSLCLSVPVTGLPILYELATSNIIIGGHDYLLAFLCANAGFAVGHVFWYGIERIHFAGARQMIFPFGRSTDWKRYMAMEAAATGMHFPSTVLVFRVIADNQESILAYLRYGGQHYYQGYSFGQGFVFIVRRFKSEVQQGSIDGMAE